MRINDNFNHLNCKNNFYKNYEKESNPANPSFTGKYMTDGFIKEAKFYHRTVFNIHSTKVKFPGLSKSTVVTKNLFPVGNEINLLIFKPKKNIYSLSEISDNKDFQKDIQLVKDYLKEMYPDREIIYFEHGSGNVTMNNQKRIVQAGKSIKFAHGHFCILPDKSKAAGKILAEPMRTLHENDWDELLLKMSWCNTIFPEYRKIFKKKNIFNKNDYPPYIHVGAFCKKDNTECSFTYLQLPNNRKEQPKTPSQLLRVIISQVINGTDDNRFWDWKRLCTLYESGSSLAEYNDIIKGISNASVDFDRRLQGVLMNNKGKHI